MKLKSGDVTTSDPEAGGQNPATAGHAPATAGDVKISAPATNSTNQR